jgi:uncharacterized protein YndB with AHSA1/START domain
VQVTEDRQFLQYAVSTEIGAPPERVWALLVDAEQYPGWNTTVVSVDGRIEDGQRIELVARIDPDRAFRLDVSDMVPARSMVWSDGNKAFSGTRTFTLAPGAEGGTVFVMREALAGWMLPMIRAKLPDFGPDFEQFAADLRRAAEAGAAVSALPTE